MGSDDTQVTARKAVILVTKNTEYHVHDRICVAVRDLRTGKWQEDHKALGTKLKFGLRPSNRGMWNAREDLPGVGDKLCFEPDILTGPVAKIEQSSS